MSESPFGFIVQDPSNKAENLMQVPASMRSATQGSADERARLMRVVNRLTFSGNRLLDDPDLELIADSDWVLIQVDLPANDAAGRTVAALALVPQQPGANSLLPALLSDFLLFLETHRLPPPTEIRELKRRLQDVLGAERARSGRRPRAANAKRFWKQRLGKGAMTSLPDDPRNRRVILPLENGDMMLLEAEQEGRRLLLDRSVVIVDLPLARPRGLLAQLEREQLLEPRSLLVQSLFDRDQYFPVAQAPERLARSKLFHSVQVCKLLGATVVDLDEVRSIDGKRIWKASASGMKIVGGSAEHVGTDNSGFVESLTLRHRFARASPDFEAATDYLTETGLHRDDHLRSLVDLRRGPNALLEQTVKVGTRSEVEQLRKWLAKCKVRVADLGTEVEKVEKQIVDYQLSFCVKF